jgi:transposase-like protein
MPDFGNAASWGDDDGGEEGSTDRDRALDRAWDLHLAQAGGRKVRDWETWQAVRRAWEAGETAASVARRFDVGLANLWRRRAAEGWERGRGPDPTPEPPQGWDRWADEQSERFLQRLADERDVARALLSGLRGETGGDMPLWHIGFYYAWRAAEMGAEVADADRERCREAPWASAVWDAQGRIRPQAQIDYGLMRLHREDWRREVGLPDGAAERWP